MLIYIEGLDKSGKTTFAKQLSEKLRVAVYRKQPPKELQLVEHHSFFKGVGFALMELHNLFGFSVIVDRSFISDWVYTNRETDILPLEIWKEWECRHDRRQFVMIIYVEVPHEVLESRMTYEIDPYMLPSDITRFKALYKTYLSKTNFQIVYIDGTASSVKRAKELLKIESILQNLSEK